MAPKKCTNIQILENPRLFQLISSKLMIKKQGLKKIKCDVVKVAIIQKTS
jgi:hypothetical protein